MVQRETRLADEDVTEVLALLDDAAAADGVYPLSEQVVLQVRHSGENVAVHLLLRDSATGHLAGYAQVDTADEAVAELAVRPAYRRRGHGQALVEAAATVSGGPLRAWAHGDLPAAGALAGRLGFARSRVLLQMRRPLAAAVAEPRLPAGVTLRPFRPGSDEDAWLAVNRRAFADHPEQGRWTRQDLEVRKAESWFDPAGFLLAERAQPGGGARLSGFHWTKVHGADSAHGTDPIGEVYVLGIDPDEQGGGLGVALTLAGLRHLRSRGLHDVMLYVDESNPPAVRLYEKLGFTRWKIDVMYRRAVPEPR